MSDKHLTAIKDAYHAMMDDYSDAYKERDAAYKLFGRCSDAEAYSEIKVAQAKMNAIISCADKIGAILYDIDNDFI